MLICSQDLIVEEIDFDAVKMRKSFETSDFNGKKNNWREVKDFNWMKQEASPNFLLVE